jgi:hypothetical protein
MLSAGGWIGAIGTFAQVWGLLEGRKSAKVEAERKEVASEFEAEQAEVAGGLAMAASQRVALEEYGKADNVASRALAVAAASGGGASDPTIINLISDIKGEGAYRASVALYEGEQQARDMKIAAATRRIEGATAIEAGVNKSNAYGIRALGTAFAGGASLYSKYGQGGPRGGKASGDSALIVNSGIE